MASAVAEALYEAALLKRYFGTATRAAAAAKTEAVAARGAPASSTSTPAAAVAAPPQLSRGLHTAASNSTQQPTMSETTRFLSMFGHKHTARAHDPMIVAAFCSAGVM